MTCVTLFPWLLVLDSSPDLFECRSVCTLIPVLRTRLPVVVSGAREISSPRVPFRALCGSVTGVFPTFLTPTLTSVVRIRSPPRKFRDPLSTCRLLTRVSWLLTSLLQHTCATVSVDRVRRYTLNRVLQDRTLPSSGLRLPLCLVVLSVPFLTLVSRLAT